MVYLNNSNNQKDYKMDTDRRSDIYPPAIPSNLKRDQIDDFQFNSIGFYSDLIEKLNDQQKTVSEVFTHSFHRVHALHGGMPPQNKSTGAAQGGAPGINR